VSGRWIRPGLRYHQQGPGPNKRWGRSGLAAMAIVYNKEKEMAITGIEKDRPTPKKDTPIPKKEVRIAVAFCCYFCFTPFFYDFKGIKTKEKDKDKEKSESGSGHSWTGTDSGPGSGPLRSGF